MSALLQAENVTVTRGAARLIREVSLQASDGEFIGVIGPNGAGKSTLLRALVGLETPQAGRVDTCGRRVSALSPMERARAIAFLPQTRPVYWSMTVESIVALGRYAYGAPARLEGEDANAVAQAMALVAIDHLKDRAAPTLSGGEAARMHLARALAADTPVLIADEPTSALDPRHQIAVMKALAARAGEGRLVIAALHDLALAAQFCTRILIMRNGAVAADGAPEDVMSGTTLSEIFETPIRVRNSEGRLTIDFA